jgi:hypothetical protein
MRKEPELTEAYRKDLEDEKFLERLNAILAPYQDEDYQDLPEIYPTLHIIGAPHSGTTLLSQLISTHLDVGYINNLMAAFWRAPIYGIRLSKKLIPRSIPSSYCSDFGRTVGIQEPHEFGYFWSSVLGYEEMLQQPESFEQSINWPRLRLILINMTHAFGRPVVFKSFFLGWHIAKMQEVLPKTCFVRIRRDPTQTAISILKQRQKYLGSVGKWVGLKPAEYRWLKDEPYWRQVAGQVYYLEKSMTEQIQKVEGRNVIEVIYEELCRNPKRILEQVKNLFERNGVKVAWLSEPPDSFEISLEKAVSDQVYDQVKKAIQEFYGD